MTNRESKFSRPSAATHRLTQASTTLNRRYVKRPTVISVKQTSTDSKSQTQASVAPSSTSRLVNLGVHTKDLPRTVATTTTTSTPSAIKVSIKTQPVTKVSTHQSTPQPTPAAPTTPPKAETIKINTTKIDVSKSTQKSAPSENMISRTNQDTFGLQPSQKSPASSTQLDTLKAFATEVKSHPTNAEMQKISAKIDHFINVMEKSDHVRTQSEIKVAATVSTSPKITRAAAQPTIVAPTTTTPKVPKTITPTDLPAKAHPLQATANHRIRAAKTRPTKSTSKDIKDRAIKQALRSVATMNEAPAQPIKRRKAGGAKRFILAFTCAAACLAAIIYFVSSNIPDVSVRVAAMQTGIEASYPSYVPMDYSLSDIISEDGKLTMIFNGPDDSRFTLVQEKSSWDSATLLRNYVEPTWGDEYATTHEQGITIYISNQTNDSTWVNGGIRYSITSEGTRLTKKQTRNIVLSL